MDIIDNIADDAELNELDDYAPDMTVDGKDLWEHYHFVADKSQSLLRIDKFLVTRIANTSRNRIQQAAEAQCILVNGKAVKSNYRVKPFDEISIVMDRPKTDRFLRK